jgi:hypothetical protein
MKQTGLSRRLSYKVVVLLSAITYLVMDKMIVPFVVNVCEAVTSASPFASKAAIGLTLLTAVLFVLLLLIIKGNHRKN